MNGTLFGQDVIKSISFDEGEILKNIHELYCPEWFEVDPCYSVGRFYEDFGIPKPKLKFDINPQTNGVINCSAELLPIESGTIKSVMYDPPFIAGVGPSLEKDDGSNKIAKRFSSFRSITELWTWYYQCIKEYARILKTGGVLVVKNQDTVSSGKNYFSHCQIMNMAIDLGFYPKDLFILLAKQRIIGGNHEVQQHARKFHCYYWVFIKEKSKVDYSINTYKYFHEKK